MALPTPLVNGVGFDFSSLDFRANNINLTKALQNITYSTNLEPGEIRGARSKLIGTTRGVQKDEAAFELLEEDGRDLIKSLGAGYGVKFFTAVLQKRESGVTHTDTLVGCRITKVEPNAGKSNAGDPATLKFTLKVTDVLLDGLSINDQTLSA